MSYKLCISMNQSTANLIQVSNYIINYFGSKNLKMFETHTPYSTRKLVQPKPKLIGLGESGYGFVESWPNYDGSAYRLSINPTHLDLRNCMKVKGNCY